MALEYEVFNDRILLEKIDDPIEEKTEGGIILPLETQEKAERSRSIFFGEVILAGAKCELVEVGDLVIYNEHQATLLPLEGEVYYLIGEQMLLGKKK